MAESSLLKGRRAEGALASSRPFLYYFLYFIFFGVEGDQIKQQKAEK